MARKDSLERGNDNYTKAIDIILNLTPTQIKLLLPELVARYTKKGHTKLYTSDGVIDKEKGKVRLTEYQYKTLKLKYGDTYMRHSMEELTNYIKWLELHQDISKYKSKLMQLNSRTHAKELDYGGWVYDKCKKYIKTISEINLNVNPYLIEDISVARKYIACMSPALRREPDVQFLFEKFPELIDEFNEE